jgi:hypothetical protein
VPLKAVDHSRDTGGAAFPSLRTASRHKGYTISAQCWPSSDWAGRTSDLDSIRLPTKDGRTGTYSAALGGNQTSNADANFATALPSVLTIFVSPPQAHPFFSWEGSGLGCLAGGE